MRINEVERLKMGKVVKFCSSCDEGFAERFGFCPVCGAQLEAFEMKRVDGEANSETPEPPAPSFMAGTEPEIVTSQLSSEVPAEAEIADPLELEIPEMNAAELEEESYDDASMATGPLDSSDAGYLADEADAPNEIEEPEIAAPAAVFKVPVATGDVYQTEPVHADEPREFIMPQGSKAEDGEYYVTVFQESAGSQRNMLLLGATFLVLTTAVAGWGISLFQKDLGVGSIGDEQSLAYLISEVPMVVDEEEKPKKDDEGGGGGGGGREDKEEVSQGDLADQSRTPTRPPDARTPRMENPSLKLPPPQTEGDRKFPKEVDRWGDPNSRYAGVLNGPGTGGGQGVGMGTGQGSGRGTGTGSGDGSGSGGGSGDGDGDGSGSGRGGPPPPPSRPVGPSTALRIVAKPKPGYTDEARKNSVQGTVVLRVMFLASGQIGSIATVKGLPNGLTEKAIAAARSIQFEPRKDSGIPKSVTRTIEYSFTMY